MLARGGGASELIERTTGTHDVVCGGFLGWDSLAALERLGVDALSLGAQPISQLRLVSGDRQVEVRLPKPAAGLSRRTLDEALLEAAADAGTSVTRGRSVRELDSHDLSVRLDDGERIATEALFLATGKHELRGAARPARATGGGSIGLRTALSSRAALDGLAGVIELHLFDGGYAGLLMQEDGSANLCLSVTKLRFAQAGGTAALIAQLGDEAPQLGARLAGEVTESWQAIAGVPYGWRSANGTPGVFRLGDQAAVISSLAGDGVAIALTSGIDAASVFLSRGAVGAASYQAAFASKARLPLRVADLLRYAVERHALRPALMRAATISGIASAAAKLTRISSAPLAAE